MIPIFFTPHPLLLDYIESIVIINFDFDIENNISSIYTFVPTHTRILCFYLADQVKVKKEDNQYALLPRSIIIGQQLKPVVLDLGKIHTCVTIILKPSGMYRLLGIPQHVMIDRDFDGSQLLGKEVDELIEQLRNSKDNAQKNILVQEYLLKKLRKLKPMLPFDRAIEALNNAGGNISVDQLAALSCLSIRQFERISLERLGLSPKLYSRVVRFNHAYKYKERFPKINWTTIAHQCGYYDQMHLIHDFKYFAGYNPGLLRETDIKSTVRFQKLVDEEHYAKL